MEKTTIFFSLHYHWIYKIFWMSALVSYVQMSGGEMQALSNHSTVFCCAVMLLRMELKAVLGGSLWWVACRRQVAFC